MWTPYIVDNVVLPYRVIDQKEKDKRLGGIMNIPLLALDSSGLSTKVREARESSGKFRWSGSFSRFSIITRGCNRVMFGFSQFLGTQRSKSGDILALSTWNRDCLLSYESEIKPRNSFQIKPLGGIRTRALLFTNCRDWGNQKLR